MQEIPIVNSPNQSLSLTLDNNRYDIRIHACKDNSGNLVMAFDIAINGNAVVTGVRAVPGFPIIPFSYLENGNFALITQNDDYPDYTQFGVTQNLIYASQVELDTLRGI